MKRTVKGAFKALVGEDRYLACREAYYRYGECLNLLAGCDDDAKLRLRDPRWHRGMRALKGLENAYRGKRCFIIGNGPSLNKMDLSHLKEEITFGMNRVFLLFPKIGFETTFLVSVNRLVLEQSNEEIARLSIPKFLPWDCREFFPDVDNTVFLNRDGRIGFSADPGKIIWESATVTHVTLQLAYYMGFQQVFLIGVDHNFETKGKPHETVVLDGDDPNHFSGEYFGKGFRWQLPDLEASERGYELANLSFAASNRHVFDATVGGKLQIFLKANYDRLFDSGIPRKAAALTPEQRVAQ